MRYFRNLIKNFIKLIKISYEYSLNSMEEIKLII